MLAMTELTISPSAGSDWFSEGPKSTVTSQTLRHGEHGLLRVLSTWQRSCLLLSRKHPGAA